MSTARLAQRSLVVSCWVVSLSLIFSAKPVQAQRPGPRPPTYRPPHAPAHKPKVKPKAKPHLPVTKPKVKAPFVKRHRYWLPYYRVKTPVYVWQDLGYTYYVGGTDYVLPAETDSEAAKRLKQIQELTDLVHEWRTINESSEVHERLPGPDAPAEARAVVANIRAENEEFDRVTRQAMLDLAEGRSAEIRLTSARSHLNKIIELVESLPEQQGRKDQQPQQQIPRTTGVGNH